MTLPADMTAIKNGGPSRGRGGGIRAWTRTTGGIVGMLFVVQFVTGFLLAFYYVPSVDHAYTTVSFIEKVLSSGSWIRSLHHYGSQWLTLFLFLHLIQIFLREAYNHATTQWVTAVAVLGLVMAAGATGYSLPWDARAFFSTRVAEGLLAGLPFVGRNARLWLLGGSEISTLTLSRVFAIHVLVTPFLLLAVIVWRFFGSSISTFFGRHAPDVAVGRVCWSSLGRNAMAAGLVFVALAIWALKVPAPLGPSVTTVTAEYLPRPGAQFLWLYQSLKYLPGGLGSLVGVLLPGIAFLMLALLPWLNLRLLRRLSYHPRRLIAGLVLACCALLILTMTVTSYLVDQRDPRTRQQLSRQAAQEEAFRREPFEPALIRLDDNQNSSSQIASAAVSQGEPPVLFLKLCANCHGEHGEGARQGMLRFPALRGVSSKPRRTVDDIVALLKDPKAFDLEPPMKSFSSKLTEPEMKEIAEWVVRLKG